MNAKRRLQYTISSMLVLTTVVAIVLGISTYYSRRRAFVIHTYDAQKAVAGDAVATFVQQLESDGFLVTNDCRGQGGSGEWRLYVAVTAVKAGQEPLRCDVEVMGFVSHDTTDQPTWAANLPMTISRRGRQLDNRFVDILTAMLRGRGWAYEVNDQFTGIHNVGGTRREDYIKP